MNPLTIARNLRDDYLTLLRTTFAPRQDHLRQAFNEQIEREGFLSREPFISLSLPYQRTDGIDGVLPETRQRFGVIAERPFLHQAHACSRIMAGQPAVVATGTGSGKTEAFLLPIVDHCLRVRPQPGVKAILIYPMNALVNDQTRRVQRLLVGSGVSFGRYTGETEQRGDRSPDTPEEVRETRAEFRARPPDILLTNYQMLEYMLLRGDGRDIFENHHVRFVVLDEVHTYKGALGTDVACLIRRLRASLSESGPGAPAPIFIGTSATLQSGQEGEDPWAGIAQFFTRLTGQETGPEAVVTEAFDPPTRPEGLALPGAPTLTHEDLAGFDPDQENSVLRLARSLFGAGAGSPRQLADMWEQSRLPYLLMEWLQRPQPLSAVVSQLVLEPERRGVSQEAVQREIEAALMLGPCLPESHPLRVRPRVHRFLRGLARFWRCVNPDCGRLLDEGVEECPACGARSLPLAICRTCGWDFFVAREDGGQAQPWTERSSSRSTVYYYDPPPARFAADDEDDPFEGDNEHRTVSNGSAGPEDDDSTAAQEEARICPECLSVAPAGGQRACTCESEHPVRPVRVHRGRGARCPVCRSRYGRYDVLTPVSLGNSRALTHVSRSLLRELPEGRRKLLVFCDSRQDASHQAQFIEGDERHLRIRRAIYTLLAREGDTHDMRWLVENLYHEYIDQGFLPRAYSRDAMRREMDRIEGGLLSEFVSAANVRAGLERLGLVRVTYAGLAAALNEENFRGFCEVNRLRFPNAQLAFERLLDFMRGRFAVTHDALRTRLVRGDRLSERYGIKPGRQIGLPVAFLQPGQRAQNTRTYKLTSTWSESGAMAGVQQLWIRHFGEQANADNLASALGWLADRHLIEWSGIGTSASEVEGYQVNWECLEAHQAASAARCVICGRIVAEGLPDAPCPRPGCEGRLVAWEGALAAQNVNALNVAAPGAEPLKPAEHSAAITDARRSEIEAGFQDDPPKVNVLVCTPTLELGVNIGDLEAVAMRNVPPSPANYAQRAGRTGRESRMGVIAGFARNTPHDGYFFDHPDEVIAGAIPAPRFNTANLQAIARHVRSLVVEEARLDFPADLQTLISEEGALIPGNVEEFIRQLRSGLEQALNRGEQVFGAQVRSLVADPRPWLAEVVRDVPQQVRDALEARAALVEAAVFRMRELGQQVRQTQRQQEAEQGYRYLARKLREDYRYAYLPRVLAESGVLPGYAFPGDPGSLSLGYDPQPVFAGRLQAQREFAPGQVVYFRGHRWRVGGAALNRPGASSRTSGADRFSYTECPACGLANRVSGANNCARCGAELSGPTMVAWDNGAFQAWPADVDPESEEERQFHAFDVRAHPQRDVTARTFVVGPWTLELRRQEEIWWINHGFLEAPAPGEPPRAVGFNLCSVCGELRPEPRPQAGVDSRRGRNRDRRADRDPHDERCGGTPERVALGHQDRADTLRLIVPGLQSQGTEGIAWAWSLAWAVVQGAVRLFDLNEDDIEPTVLTRTGERGQEALEIIWIDDVLGGSGILQELTARFPAVAAAASEHLRGHECPSSCYRCLRHYRNQRIHRLLSWRLVAPYLAVVAAETIRETVTAAPAVTQEGPDWEEARREGCGSPLELRLLRAIREAGLPEPDKQVSISSSAGRLLTVADFAYQDAQLLIYVDGLAFHSSLRMRIHDANQTNQVQAMGYRVLRFVGPQVYSRVDMCVDQIRNALAGFEQH